MSDIIDSRDLLDELKTFDEEDSYDKERIEMIIFQNFAYNKEL